MKGRSPATPRNDSFLITTPNIFHPGRNGRGTPSEMNDHVGEKWEGETRRIHHFARRDVISPGPDGKQSPLNAAHSTRSGLILQACIMHSKGDAKRRREQKKSDRIFLSKRDGLQSVF